MVAACLLIATGVAGRSAGMAESDCAAMLRALVDEDALRVFAQLVVATGTGPPERSAGSITIQYVTAHGLSRHTGLPVNVVLGVLKRLTDAGLTIEKDDGDGWRTDFAALRRAAYPNAGDGSLALPVASEIRKCSSPESEPTT
jgi:DNA-binding transcriptional ArsR family regulator